MQKLINHTAPLRVLMTTDTVGGVWSYSIELCKALHPFKVHVYLVTTGASMQHTQKKEADNLENVTVYETDFLLEWMHNPWESIETSGYWLLKLEEELQPDLIHLNSFSYGSLAWRAPVVVVAHSDVYSWWLSAKGDYPPLEWNTYFDKIRTGLQGADYIIAPSKWMMKQVRKIYSVDTPGSVIYNGRDKQNFYSAAKTPSLFSMGRLWDEAKNIGLLIKAAPSINSTIRIAGAASFASGHLAPEGININYLGPLPADKIAEQLSMTSVYVLPAKYEPFGLSVLEAALSGCALVLGNIDSFKEIWEDNAIYVDINDADALSDTVNKLMNNDPMLGHYAQAALKHADKYTTAAMAEAYLEVYCQMQQKEYATPINYVR